MDDAGGKATLVCGTTNPVVVEESRGMGLTGWWCVEGRKGLGGHAIPKLRLPIEGINDSSCNRGDLCCMYEY